MYIRIDRDRILRREEIVGIFDLDAAAVGGSTDPVVLRDKAAVGGATKGFLQKAEEQNQIQTIGAQLPKSFLVCTDGRVIFSQYAASVLLRRANTTIDDTNGEK